MVLFPKALILLKMWLACTGRQNISLEDGQKNPYVGIVAVLEQALPEGSATELTKPLRALLQIDREQRVTGGVRKQRVVVAHRLLNMRSPTPSVASPGIMIVPSRVPSPISVDVVTSPAVITPSGKSPSTQKTCSSGAASLQLKTS